MSARLGLVVLPPGQQRPVVVTVASATAADRARAAEAADVVVAGDTDADLSAAVAVLGERGYDNVLAEGVRAWPPSSPPPACSTRCA